MTLTKELEQDLRGFLYLRQDKLIGAMLLTAFVAVIAFNLFSIEIPKTQSVASSFFKFALETSGGLFLYALTFVGLCLRCMCMRMGEYEATFRTVIFFGMISLSMILVSASHTGWLYVWLG